MKNALILFTFLFCLTCCAQNKNCQYELYDLIYEDMEVSKHVLEVSMGYSPEKSTLESLSATNTLTEEELSQVEKSLKTQSSNICDSSHEKIQRFLHNNSERKDGSYEKYIFSNPIPISNSKKGVFSLVSIKSTKHKGGKVIGAEVLYIFERNDEKWELKEKRSLAVY